MYVEILTAVMCGLVFSFAVIRVPYSHHFEINSFPNLYKRASVGIFWNVEK